MAACTRSSVQGHGSPRGRETWYGDRMVEALRSLLVDFVG